MKILIVDDDPTVCHYFTRLAKLKGYTDIDTVGSGEEALTQTIRRKYDLITLDLQMPGVSGLEILAMLRTMCPHAVIAIISGYLYEAMSAEVASCADMLIPKPVDIDVFLELLNGVEQISQIMKHLRELGTLPVEMA